ncbi:DUF1857 family protein [Planosporangium thailandense]|uniref:DUF1857 family protein n=1 Tax=Planosporangium thailandense TaxID=765197 RepID=A0ABX0XXC2_9ACTN|nr:AtaL-like protein [Planosporangium thailandense]NJC70697.1 DUF1857 family protein [Planosporangium thailandense]
MSWTTPLTDPSSPDATPVDRHRLWRSLLAKAEAPTNYVPAITACRILERYDDGFLREIVRNGERLVQRVRPEPERRILFEHIGDPDVASIANVIGTDASGATTFTIEIVLAAGGAARALQESDFLRTTDEYFADTIEAIVRALRPLSVATLDQEGAQR